MVDTQAALNVTRTRARLRPVARSTGKHRAAKRAKERYEAQKRAFDVVVASLLLVLSSPLLIALWLLVRVTSPGPGIYWSVRVGRHGRNFEMPKFRTMRQSAVLAPREALANADEDITLLGRVLRRFSLDELPQFYSILRGHMSFVGPRPLLPMDPGTEERRAFPAVFTARPGLSGIAQVTGRNRLSSRRKARLDAFYARSFTPSMDARILLRTVVVVVTGRGFI